MGPVLAPTYFKPQPVTTQRLTDPPNSSWLHCYTTNYTIKSIPKLTAVAALEDYSQLVNSQCDE